MQWNESFRSDQRIVFIFFFLLFRFRRASFSAFLRPIYLYFTLSTTTTPYNPSKFEIETHWIISYHNIASHDISVPLLLSEFALIDRNWEMGKARDRTEDFKDAVRHTAHSLGYDEVPHSQFCDLHNSNVTFGFG